MWIISQIGGKNMTGKLQNRIPSKFFLTRASTAFPLVYQHFLSSSKRLQALAIGPVWRCEYQQKSLSLPRLVKPDKRWFSRTSL
jgi:hypothetical protein